MRYAEPRAFANFVARAQRPAAVPCATGEQIMLSLIEALFDRMADTLERAAADIEAISRSVFRHKAKRGRIEQDARPGGYDREIGRTAIF